MKPKICKIHGLLELGQYIIEKTKTGFTRRCKVCRSKQNAKYVWKQTKCQKHGELTLDGLTKTGQCRLCHNYKVNERKKNNRDDYNKRMEKNREKYPEKWKEIYKKIYQQQKNKYGNLLSLKKCCDDRGITIERYNELLVQQNHVCAICFQSESRKDPRTKMTLRLAIDHCHKTNKVRGLLCHNCNSSLGKMNDDPIRLIRASRYVKNNGFCDIVKKD